MENEILIALLTKMVEDKVSQLHLSHGQRGPRGQQGPRGEDGKSFIFSEHEETIKSWAKEYALKFNDLSTEEIEKIRGPRGRDGRDFNFSEHEETIKSWAKEYALKFDDLTAEQISLLRGPRGRDGEDGSDGKDFQFEEHRERIFGLVKESVGEIRESLRLKLSDLNADEINELRGPRGRDGRDGRDGSDFNFDEHRDYFESLRLKFSDLTDNEKDSLKLHFSMLTEEEKSSLKLKFSDLTEDERALIRGPRGPRGQRGSQGIEGKTGSIGPRGPQGLPGPRGVAGVAGLRGIDGSNGRDGKDAPTIVAIDIEQIGDEIIFIFEFSDGSVIRSDRMELPTPVNVYNGGISGGKSSMAYEIRIDEVSETVTYVGKALPGAETNNPVWQIRKIVVSGTETSIEWADGDAFQDNIWDNRISLTYF